MAWRRVSSSRAERSDSPTPTAFRYRGSFSSPAPTGAVSMIDDSLKLERKPATCAAAWMM